MHGKSSAKEQIIFVAPNFQAGAGLFGHKGIESLGFRGHLTLDFPAKQRKSKID